jgi:oxygen-dependent protoporphyrinogen oxidase
MAIKRIIVIGGGIGGLCTAYRLRQLAQQRQEALELTILEGGERWGGVIASSHEQGFLLEHGPDSMLRSKTAGVALIEELGLGQDIISTRESARSSLIARGQRLLPVPEGLYLMAPARILPFLGSPLLSWAGKLRMALDLVLPRRALHAPEESLADFVCRRLGREALERIAQPLISGIYTADPQTLSLAATLPIFQRMEREHRSIILGMRARARDPAMLTAKGPRYGLFITMRAGVQSVIDRLIDRLTQPAPGISTTMRLNSKATAVVRENQRFIVALEDEYQEADQVVVATPAYIAGPICRTLDEQLAYLLVTIPYAGVVTVNLAFDHAQIAQLPEAAGFVVPAIEQRELIACTIVSRKFEERAPVNRVLLRAFLGGALHPATMERSNPELIELALNDLRDLLKIQGAPLFSHVHRWPRSMPQYVVGHLECVQGIRSREASIPGFALVGNGYEGVGIPDIIEQANRAARRLIGAQEAATQVAGAER